jgi:hypothetical protein
MPYWPKPRLGERRGQPVRRGTYIDSVPAAWTVRGLHSQGRPISASQVTPSGHTGTVEFTSAPPRASEPEETRDVMTVVASGFSLFVDPCRW